MTKPVIKVVAGLCAAWIAGGAGSSAADFSMEQQAFFKQHCSDCHDATAKEGGLVLAALSNDLSDAETLRRWVRVFDRVEGAEMPPKSAPQPDPGARQTFLAALAPRLTAADRPHQD